VIEAHCVKAVVGTTYRNGLPPWLNSPIDFYEIQDTPSACAAVTSSGSDAHHPDASVTGDPAPLLLAGPRSRPAIRVPLKRG
jgi:hypothetical protein